MANTPNPTNPTPQGTTPIKKDDQNLDINLDEAPKTDSPVPKETTKTETDLDLNLDLNLEDAPKSKDRLKEEDKKNQENEEITKKPEETKKETTENIPAEKKPIVEKSPVEEKPVINDSPKINEPSIEEKPSVEKEPVIEEETSIEEKPVIEDSPKINETTPVEKTPVEKEIANPVAPKAATPVIPTSEESSPKINEPVVEKSPVEEKSSVKKEPVIEEETPKINEPSSSIEEIPSSPETPTKENIIEPKTLKEDMKIINELETQANSGGLHEEAKIDTKPTTGEEKPKTFDLDAMLGTTPVVQKDSLEQETTSDLFKAKPEETQKIEQAPVMEQTPPTPEITPTPTPRTTLPPQTNNERIYNTTATQKAPQQKDKKVKILLFVVLFAVLGFITYFILQTMYPVEFGNMFSGNTTEEVILENTEELTGEVEELTGTIEEMTGAIDELTGTIEETTETTIHETGTGDHESPVDFGELNDLGTPTEVQPEVTDISKLTDYVNKGNELREIGKEINNNTVIKFSLYIKTKATSFLEKIAKGEEISNLDSYFAQFDQYTMQIEELITTTTPEEVSPLVENNAEETSSEPEAMTNSF